MGNNIFSRRSDGREERFRQLLNYLRDAERGAVVYCDMDMAGGARAATEVGNAITKIVTFGNYKMKTYFEHSGVYIGEVNGQHLIAELVNDINDDGKAKIRYTDAHRFMARLDEKPKKEGKIYIACKKGDKNHTLCNEKVYERATKGVLGQYDLKPNKLYDLREIASKRVEYDPLCDLCVIAKPNERTNCHKFVQYCLVGKFKDKYGSFEMLMDNITSELGAFDWIGMPIQS
ncbi:hypothetical protein HAL013_10770 [Helicobacter ailurogastricus]|uniref:Uncharacterized protein n=2 Tax=Helicobacter ailurogastricus TaxID=1578720 RepID=A0A0K2X6Q9_9HELI|nr:hypothetical protein HAL011_01300 [Helicobacter ailurogastricus]CRF42866.1 hypothetical protein HAL013_10770 [Helicobacter ailurogastricus]CRF43788.1 hypothetical protein HAL09_03400 [Helicobacter ailurogastricus]